MQLPVLKQAVQIVVSIACVGWVVHIFIGVDWQVAGTLMRRTSFLEFGFCLLLAILLYASRLLRLRLWARHIGKRRLPLSAWVDLYLKSIAFGSITPARLGDFSRIALLKATGLDLKARGRLVFYDKIIDLLYVPVTLMLTAAAVETRLGVSHAWLSVVGSCLLLLYFFGASVVGAFLTWKDQLMGYGIALAGLMMFILSNYFLFRSAGVALSLLDIAAITITVGVMANLPISLGGIGVRESSLLVVLGRFGVDANQAAPVLVLEFILNLVFPIALYGCWRLAHNCHGGEGRPPG